MSSLQHNVSMETLCFMLIIFLLSIDVHTFDNKAGGVLSDHIINTLILCNIEVFPQSYGPRREKTGLQDFRPSKAQTSLLSSFRDLSFVDIYFAWGNLRGLL